MPAQIVDQFRPLPQGEIVGATDHRQRDRRRQTHRDHVGLDELAGPDAGVKSFGRDIDQLRARGDLHFDLGIGLAERCDQRPQHRHDRPCPREAQQPGRPLAKVAGELACGDELLECGLGARNESFAGFGQADTARGADEERCSYPRLEGADRLADRRRGYPELRGRLAETAVLGDAEERLHAVERALPDCEVLLHGPTTLSWIVAHGKRSYIRVANRTQRRCRAATFAASSLSPRTKVTAVIRETKPMKAIRRAVLALTLTLTGATSMSHPSAAQTQATSPATTGVMVILTVKPGITREQVMAVMPAEIRQTMQLYLNGKIREWYSRGDGRGVVFLLDAKDIAEAEAVMEG